MAIYHHRSESWLEQSRPPSLAPFELATPTTARRSPWKGSTAAWTLALTLWALWMLLGRVPISRATPSLRRSRSGAHSSAMASVTHVPAHTLFVSEPPPELFGNGPNPSNGRGWTNGNWVRAKGDGCGASSL